MALSILRGVFIILIVAVTVLYVLDFQEQYRRAQEQRASLDPSKTQLKEEGPGFTQIVVMMAVTLGIGAVVIATDVFTKRKKLAALSGVFLGLLAGLLVAYALGFVVDLVGVLFAPRFTAADDRVAFLNLLRGVKVFIGLVTCYLGMSLVLQTKDDFRFVIPYIEFSKQMRGQRPVLLDTSVIIDGRVVDIAQTRFVSSGLIVPRFVLHELQAVADSSDKLRRARGRRGLDILQKLQADPMLDVSIHDVDDVEGSNVDQKLVSLAQEMGARVMTNDYNLAKICDLRKVEVMNLNDLAKALRPVVLPGEKMTVKAIRAGESAGQAVGYLEDGTMVVIEKGQHMIGQEIDLIVTSTLQTSAGRMIFGRLGDGSSGHMHASSKKAGDGSESAAPMATDAAPHDSHAEHPGEAGGSPSSPSAMEDPSLRRPRPAGGRNPRRSH